MVDIPPVELMYLVFTRMPGESHRRRLRYLLLCYHLLMFVASSYDGGGISARYTNVTTKPESFTEAVPLVEFMCLVFTRVPARRELP